MGADMIATWCDYPHWWNGSEEGLKALESVDLDPIEEEIVDHLFGGDPPEGFDLLATVMDAYRDAANSRYVTSFDVHGHLVWVAGGPSWGDTPPAYDSVWIVSLVEGLSE